MRRVTAATRPREGLRRHGPAPRGYIGVPARASLFHSYARAVMPMRSSCAATTRRCVWINWRNTLTSVHGRRLVEHKDDKVAMCASCHTPHSIRPASDPQSSVNPTHVEETCGRCHADATYMAPYGIPTDRLALNKQSVHWHTLKEVGDLSAPSCNDCHGNHGASPPGVDSVGNVCGQCHAVQGDLYRGSRHATIFQDIGMPGCATCHLNHDVLAASDSLLGVGESAACGACHSADDANGKVAMEMRALLDTLRTEHEAARDLLLRAERSGIEISQAQFDLNGAFDQLVKARAAIHNFTVAGVRTPVDEGRAIAARAHDRGIRALEEFAFRRRGLAVSVLIILTLIAALVMKIRQIERPIGSVPLLHPRETVMAPNDPRGVHQPPGLLCSCPDHSPSHGRLVVGNERRWVSSFSALPDRTVPRSACRRGIQRGQRDRADQGE